MTTKPQTLLLLPGDGIGPEVTEEACRVAAHVAPDLVMETAFFGGVSYDNFGTPLTDEVMARAKQVDAILMGAVGGPKWDGVPRDKRPEAGLLRIRKEAERLKTKLLEEEKIVDLVAGPDAYRDLPKLIAQVDEGDKAINTFLSREETYGGINPVRLNSNGVTAFVSIMRVCDNMCSFCVVPFTRGRERSRDPHSIVAEAKALFEQGYREGNVARSEC